MICYQGIINGISVAFKVNDGLPETQRINFEEDDPNIISIYETELNKIELKKLKNKLLNTDYIACKIAEGEATKEEYAEIISERREWRNRINKLELLINN